MNINFIVVFAVIGTDLDNGFLRIKRSKNKVVNYNVKNMNKWKNKNKEYCNMASSNDRNRKINYQVRLQRNKRMLPYQS